MAPSLLAPLTFFYVVFLVGVVGAVGLFRRSHSSIRRTFNPPTTEVLWYGVHAAFVALAVGVTLLLGAFYAALGQESLPATVPTVWRAGARFTVGGWLLLLGVGLFVVVDVLRRWVDGVRP